VRRSGFQWVLPFVPTIVLLVGWLVQPFGRTGTILFFLGSLLSLGFGIACAHLLRNRMESVAAAERIRRISSIKRHDWMNHIQVLMGYLMMKKEDRLKAYMQKLVERAGHERNLSESRYAPLSASLLILDDRFKDWEIEWNVPKAIRFSEVAAEKKLFQLLETLFQFLEAKGEAEKGYGKLQISLVQNDPWVHVKINWQLDELPFRIAETDEKTLKNKLQRWQAKMETLSGRNGMEVACCLSRQE
jgi:hypothetical protein